MSEQKAGPPPEPAEIAGRYQVVQRLGAGAFGTVYKARDKLLGRMVAIKTIRLEGLAAASTSVEELTERFKREAQVSAQLKHPNIVTIYDIGEAQGMSYLAMEFIDGVGLERVIASDGRLPVERAASLGAQVADALDFAHRNGVVHRDIKPANVMVETGDRVKVTDFGIAKVTTSGEHLTMTGSLLGTPSYMSPEQARGGSIDGRSDLFSLGCVVYEMIAGKKAFRGDSITGLIFKIITEEPPPLKELDAGIPDELIRIVNKSLAKAPDARYQSGRELADDLLTLTRAGSSPTLRQTEMATSPGLPASRGPVAAAGSPPTVAVSPTVAGAPPTRKAPPPAPAAAPPVSQVAGAAARPAPPERSGAGLLLGLFVAGLMFVGLAVGTAWYFLRTRPAAAPAEGGLAAGGTVTAGALPEASLPTASVEPTGAAAQPAALESTPPPAGPAEEAPSQPDREAPPPAAAASRAAAAPPPGVAEPQAEASFLDEEQADGVDGTEAARRLADGYRSEQGGRSRTSFGSNARFKARERSPRNIAPAERPAVAALRHVMNAEEMFYKKESRYGTLADLASARLLFLDVPHQARQFLRKNYRFELTLEADGFSLVAIPAAPGLRPFVGDDTGFIREGVE